MSFRIEQSASAPAWLRWYGSRRYRRYGWVIGVVLILAYLLLFAGLRAERVYQGRYGSEADIGFADGSASRAVLLGGTTGFVFLYHPDQGAASVHPYDSVAGIRLVVPRAAE